MSALVNPQRNRVKATQPKAAPLRPLPAPVRPRSNAPFIGLLAAVLGVGMGGAILLNTVIEEQARTLDDMQKQSVSLSNQQALLVSEVNELRSPRVLALKAIDLGMVPNPNPAYIDLKTGEIIGTPTVVEGDEIPSITGGLR